MNIIVTGASRGIGYSIVKNFANAGHKVLAISRNEEKLKLLADECNSFSSNGVIPMPFDLDKIDTRKQIFISNIKKKFNHLDILINNAGYLKSRLFENTDAEIIRRSWSINFKAPLLLIQLLLPFLKKSHHAHIINIGSMGGIQGSVKFPGLSIYSSSKAALATLTECLAEEYKDQKMAFNYLALGAVQTEMLEEAFPEYRAPLSANEMAEFIVHFSLHGYNYFNGKILPVSISTP